MKIADNGTWLNDTAEGHCYDGSLAAEIGKFCRENNLSSVLDLGCGDGSYVKYLNNHFEIMAMGVDGNPNTTALAGTNQWCYPCELHKPFSITSGLKERDLILSLEVGEHIPAEYEATFLDNVVKYAMNWVILSWAILGQGGDGHVNCQPNDYIISQMNSRGFILDAAETNRFRAVAKLIWFKDTLMVFHRM